ncbi:hypothetical protein ABGB19_24265, partial [Mycobacterium sp. B14F4]|uniref:hypothetical protein n=1 Tax=Mycobacterium sp. B14F4 TaxID=3153565 RepID=UPI00325CC524
PSNQSKTGQKNITPLNGKKGCDKKQQTKTTKHTIEFSNNTPAFGATLPVYNRLQRDVKPRPPVLLAWGRGLLV